MDDIAHRGLVLALVLAVAVVAVAVVVVAVVAVVAVAAVAGEREDDEEEEEDEQVDAGKTDIVSICNGRGTTRRTTVRVDSNGSNGRGMRWPPTRQTTVRSDCNVEEEEEESMVVVAVSWLVVSPIRNLTKTCCGSSGKQILFSQK
jgi:uncharacterized membrane protein